METNFSKPNPKKILGYLMAFAMVFFTTSYAIAQNACTVTVGGGSYDSEITWDITDASGAIIASGAAGTSAATLTLGNCYDMNMYDSYGDGWNGATYSIVDDGDGTVYASGGLASGAAGTDNFCPTAPVTCTDNEVDFVMYDSWGDGWNGGTYTLTDASGNVAASGGLASGSTATDTWCLVTGCYDLVVGGGSYDGEISFDFGALVGAAAGTYNYVSVGGATCGPLGCTDPTAANYDANAVVDDGSCTYGVPGCMDTLACNYDAAATADDGSCTYAAAGYDCAGNCLSGSEVTLTLTDSYGDTWNGGTLTINGVVYDQPTTAFGGASDSYTFCMDLSVCTDIIYTAGGYSYENSWSLVDDAGNVLASGGDNSGIVGNAPGFDCAGNCLSGDQVTLNLYDSWGDGWNGNELIVDGIAYTVSTAQGLSASYTICVDLTACIDIIYNAAGSWQNENSWDVVDANGVLLAMSAGPNSGQIGACAVYGCTDSTAVNYDPAADTDDGSCSYCVDNYVTITCGGGSWQGEVSWTLWNSAGAVVLNTNTGAGGGAPYSSMECLPDDCYTLEMFDSFGDGWNGNVFDISMGGVSLGSATLSGGATGSADFSVGSVCPVLGCTDSTATNYDPLANTDDGSCMASCTAAPYCENFDLGVGTWTNNGWVNDAFGTTSGNTGPTDDITGGGFYMYYETSTGYSPTVDMTSECLDISALATPTLSFYNHMFGATIGTLEVSVNGNLEWTMSGDQGNQWNFVQVDLSAYVGTNVTIKIEAFYGGSFTGDIAIDNVCVDEFLVTLGCTDPTALNWDATANTDDGSCTYCTGTMLTLNMFDSWGDGWNGATWTATGVNTGTVYGPYTIATGMNAVEMMCMDDDCYDIVCGGGSWDSEVSWNVTDDATGIVLASGGAPFSDNMNLNSWCPTYGCTDPAALNFDSIADTDDGSCAYICDVYIATSGVDAPPSCNGASDASATAYIAGTFGDDYYLWSDGQTSSTATGLAAGTYTCTVTDSVNGCSSTTTVVIDPTPVISIVGAVVDATPGNSNGGVDITVSGGTPCYDGASISLAGTPNTTTQWASNAFDVIATSDLQITSIDQPSMAGVGTADVYYRLGSGSGFEADPNGWILAGSGAVMANVTGAMSNIPVSINVDAGETICIYVHGIGVNTVFGAGVDSTYNSVVSSDANLSIIGGFATGGAPGAGTTYPSAGSYDFGGNINYDLSSYTYVWSSGDTTQNVSGLGLGPISVTVTDCNGCTGLWSGFVLTNYVYGCMDTLASNYDASANTSWDQDTTGATPACIYPGCTDVAAVNYDAGANQDDGSCFYNCMYYGWDDELTVTLTPDWYSNEISWYIINALTGDTALASQPYASGGAVDIQTLCADNGCYYVEGYDTWGDGWGANSSLDIVDAAGNNLLSFNLSFGTYATSSVFSVGGANCSSGCTDTAYTNYDANAVIDDGSCTDTIIGCTDPLANNYTPFSNVDDGSCCYDNVVSISVGGGSFLGEVSWDLVDGAGTIVLSGGAPYTGDACLLDDCYTVMMYDSWGDGWNGSTFTASAGGVVIGSGGLATGSAGSFTFAVGTGSCAVFGCIDPAADNYDPLATDDDGSCCYDNSLSITTGINYYGTPYNWSWNGQTWSVNLLGDTNVALTGSTIYGGLSAGDDADGCLPDGCYEFVAADASGWIGAYAWFNINGTLYEGPGDPMLGSYGVPAYVTFALGAATCPIQGCTDPLSVDYDSTATYDDGSCTYPCLDNLVDMNMYDSFGDGWNGAIYTITDDATGAVVATGGLATGAFELGTLCIPDGCYTIVVGGGTWDSEITFDFAGLVGAAVGTYNVTIGNASCNPGCMDPLACNYDPAASADDGSCEFTSCYGCTDPLALNYDSSMTYDDGSCFYCGLTASTSVVDATPGNSDGSVDLTVSGTNCITNADLLVSVAGGNGQSGNAFNVINTTGGDMVITGFSQGPGSGNQSLTGVAMEVWMYAGDYTTNMAMSGWTQVGSATVDLTSGLTTGYIAVSGVTIPAGGTYGFIVASTTNTVQYTNGTGTPGVSAWASDAYITVTEGHGGTFAGSVFGFNFSPRNWNGTVHYNDPSVTAYTYVWNTGDITEDLSNVGAGTYSVTATDCWGCTVTASATVAEVYVYGCTDPTMFNYDPAANTDDGSCIPVVDGCIDPNAINYDPAANTDDGSCLACAGVTVAPFLETFDTFGNLGAFTDDYGAGGSQGATVAWTQDALGTGSFGTGPSDDITGGGYYMYTETSGAGSNKTAILFSTCVDVTALSDPCMQFNYHMYGATMGTLEVHVDGVPVWSVSGDQGDQWNDGQVNLPLGSTGCLIQFVGLTGTSYTSDMAIDQVSVDECTVLAVYGCTDPTAVNYDPAANTDDGSCSYCTDNYVNITCTGGSFQNEVSWTMYDGSGAVVLLGGAPYSSAECLPDDCYTVDMVDSWGDGWNGNTFDVTDASGALIATGTIVTGSTGSFSFALGSASCSTPGCMDPTATNYDPAADVDDGSCIYSCASQGLDDITINLYDSWGDGWNGNTLTVDSNVYTMVTGSSISFNVCADLSTCINALYNASGSWQAENSWDITDGSGNVLIFGANIGSGGDFGTCVVSGCTDPLACNYDPSANTDDGSCLTAYGCTDPTAFNYDANATCDDGSCVAVVSGCTDPLACNYDSTANTDDGSCNTAYGCMDATMFNYDPNATCDDGSCISFVYGCTDATALNYNSGANTDDGTCVYLVNGCTDPTACNYDASATNDDGSCEYTSCVGCQSSPITGLFISNIIDDRVTANFDNMNTYDSTGAQICRVDQLRIRYREVGTTAWLQKNMGSPVGYDTVTGICNSTQRTDKPIYGLTLGTTYEWEMKAWYCATGATAWVVGPNFTTADECSNIENLSVVSLNTVKARFTWDLPSNGDVYSFCRLKMRADTSGGITWFNVGGMGIVYPAITKDKAGLVPGMSYRAQARTWCSPTGGAYNSLNWTSLIFWTQPTSVRVEGGSAIANLDVYPNPSRDIFNVTFTSEDAQDLDVRIINVVGEVIYTENLEQFIGEYTKQVDLATYTKGVYFLEITTNNGVINKKLILQ